MRKKLSSLSVKLRFAVAGVWSGLCTWEAYTRNMHKARRLLFAVNPISGGGAKQDWEGFIRNYFEGSEHTIEIFTQTGDGDRLALRQRMQEFEPDTIAAVGGDGSVKLVADVVKETAVRLAIIPAGSANGLAKELGISTDVQVALKIVVEGEEKGMDAIKINEEELCFHLSDIGLNALLVKYFEQAKVRGMWGYARSLVKMLLNKRKMRVTLEMDGETVKRKAYMVALANAEKYGTGAVINPGGDVHDGCFEVVVVRKIHVVEILKSVTAHRSFNPKRVEVFRTKSLKLTLQQKAPFQVDGEYMGKTASLHARILPGVVKVLLPKADNQ